MNEKIKIHYSEYIDSFFNNVVPDDLFDKVKGSIGENFNERDIKEVMRQLKLQKYYEYIPYIECRLKTGKDIEFFDKNTAEEIKRIYGIFIDNFYKIHADISPPSNFYLTCKILEKMGISNKYFDIKRVNYEKRTILDKTWDKVMN